MAVTEVAILHCSAGNLTPELLEIFQQAVQTQEAWCARNFPGSPASIQERGTWVFQQIEDPSNVILCAKWERVDAHWQWIQSPENQSAMGTLMQHIVSEGDKKVILSHLDTDIFSSPEDSSHTPLLSSPVISIDRMFVSADEKAAFTDKFNGVKGLLEDVARPFQARGGWAIEKQVEAQEEFVFFCGWESVDRHIEFAKSNAYQQLMSLATGVDIKNYRRVL